MYWRMSHQARSLVAYGSWVAWQRTSCTVLRFRYLRLSPNIGFRTAAARFAIPRRVLQRDKIGIWIPTQRASAMLPSRRSGTRLTPAMCLHRSVFRDGRTRFTLRPRTGNTVSQVLCARLKTRKLLPQNANISGMNGIPSSCPSRPESARISSLLRTSTQSPTLNLVLLLHSHPISIRLVDNLYWSPLGLPDELLVNICYAPDHRVRRNSRITLVLAAERGWWQDPGPRAVS